MADRHFPFEDKTLDEIQALAISIPFNAPEHIAEFMALSDRDMFTGDHRGIYDRMKAVYDKHGKMSKTLLKRELIDHDWKGINDFFEHMENTYCRSDDLESFLGLLGEKAAEVSVKRAIADIQRAIAQGDYDGDLQEFITRKLTEAVRVNTVGDVKTLSEVLDKCLADMEMRKNNTTELVTPIGFTSLNSYLHGLRDGELTVLAGRPSMGKSTLASNIMENVTARKRYGVFFSLEMKDRMLVDRMIMRQAKIASNDYTVIPITEDVLSRGRAAAEKMRQDYGDYLHIVDRPNLTTEGIRAIARMTASKTGDVSLIVVDYLTIIRPSGNTRGMNSSLMYGLMVRDLRALGQELECPVILICQLNRGIENRDKKRPQMSDLRESGNIEEYADNVLMLYREDYYNPQKAEDQGVIGMCEVLIRKQRQGPTGKCFLRYNKETMEFLDLEFDKQAELMRNVDD